MVKIVVAGSIGAGKSTLAEQLSKELGIPYAEVDALYHGPNWTKRPTFEADVDAFTRQPNWITEWQYDEARPLLADRAELFVWLDLPLPLVLSRVTRRTVRRWLFRQELWAGNREQPLWKIFWDRSNAIRWSLASRHHVPAAVPELRRQHPDLQVVRLKSRKQVREFANQAARDHQSSRSG